MSIVKSLKRKKDFLKVSKHTAKASPEYSELNKLGKGFVVYLHYKILTRYHENVAINRDSAQ